MLNQATLVKEDVCKLNDEARRILVKEVLEKFEKSIVIGNERITWSDLILSQARKIGKFLRGEISRYEGFWLRW